MKSCVVKLSGMHNFLVYVRHGRSGICSVVNLQLPWEHSRCGPGMESSGFTYQSEELMNNGGQKNKHYEELIDSTSPYSYVANIMLILILMIKNDLILS